jgi:hypothetical protein
LRGEGRNGPYIPYLKGRGFYRLLGGLLVKVGYFTNRVKLHGQWGPRLDTLVHRGWIDLAGCSYWLLGTEVAYARDGSWSCHSLA